MINSWGIRMNSFESDMKRALCSKGFLAGLALVLAMLMKSGFDSQLYRVSVPVLASLPYTTAWLAEEQSGFSRFALMRAGRMPYILGKYFACGISGGLVEALPAALYRLLCPEEAVAINLWLVFLSGMLWAVTAAVLTALAKSRYIAYGGSFVVYYILVILHERYFPTLYCLYPYEWFAPTHVWIFGWQGIVIFLAGLLLFLLLLYYELLRRCMAYG